MGVLEEQLYRYESVGYIYTGVEDIQETSLYYRQPERDD